MTPQELKNSILQLAIQGKLVEQRAEEGTGSELLEKIFAAKNAKDAKGKGEKSHAKSAKSAKVGSCVSREEIPDDEKPFDIPESWEWVRLESIVNSVPSKQYQILESEVRTSGKFAVISQSKEYSIGFTDISEKVYHHVNPVIVFGDHTTEVKYVEFDFVVGADGVKIFEPLDGLLLAKYLLYVLLFNTYDLSKVGGYSRHYKFLKNKPIPLPPLAEQKRIVAKIEELMPLVYRYEKAWRRLEDFNKRFPIDMQKSLLQMAIQGKLVEQRAEEGTGEELYRQIQVERERLIRNGAVKAEKPFDPISDDEKPFEIPENWTWVRFGNLGSYKKGPFGSALTKSIFVTKGADSVKVYEQKNAIQKDATLGEYYIRRDYFETKMSGFEVHSGDVIVSCAGTIGETYVLPEGIEQGIINQALMRMKIFVPMYVPYFLMFFDVVLKQSARANSKGSAIKNIPPFEILKNYLVPLPPLAEQKRIVAKIEELLPLIDRYEKAWSKFDFKR